MGTSEAKVKGKMDRVLVSEVLRSIRAYAKLASGTHIYQTSFMDATKSEGKDASIKEGRATYERLLAERDKKEAKIREDAAMKKDTLYRDYADRMQPYREGYNDSFSVQPSQELRDTMAISRVFITSWLIEQMNNGNDVLGQMYQKTIAEFAVAWMAGWRPSVVKE